MIADSFTNLLGLKGSIPYNAEISKFLQRNKNKEESYFTVDDLMVALKSHEPQIIKKSEMAKLIYGVQKYCTSNSKFLAKNQQSMDSIQKIFNNPFIEENNIVTISIFDIQSIGALRGQDKSKFMTMFASTVTGQIFDYINKINPPKSSKFRIGMPKVWLIYDEAHNLLPEKSNSNNNMKRIMQEGRSLGAFGIIISQKPQGVDITARAQAMNKIYSQVTFQSIIGDLSPILDNLKEKLKDKISKSTKSTKLMTLINENYPEGILFYPLTSPQCVLAKTDIINLLE